MGLFSWGKKSDPVITNKVWKTDAARMKGLMRECLLAIKAGHSPVVIVWFPDARQSLIRELQLAALPFTASDIDSSGGNTSDIRVVDGIKEKVFVSRLAAAGTPSFFWLGRYPLQSVEQEWISSIRSRFPNAPGCNCLSLDDKLFEVFAGQQLRPLLEKLGLGDDEYIEHAMIDKSITNVLDKIAGAVTAERKANSEAQWFALNYTPA